MANTIIFGEMQIMTTLTQKSIRPSVGHRIADAVHGAIIDVADFCIGDAFHAAMADYANLCAGPDQLKRKRLDDPNHLRIARLRGEIEKLGEIDNESVEKYGRGYFWLALASRLITGREYEPKLPSENLFSSFLNTLRR